MDDSWGAAEAGRVPLFDRLVDEDLSQRSEARPKRSHDLDALRASVRRDLERLLGTRCPLPGDVALSRQRTVVDYGLPDLDLGGRSLIKEERLRVARIVRQTIEAYEPRLSRIEVELLDPAEGGARYHVVVRAVLVTERVREPLSFTMPLPEAR
ncbi:type VI secretion system baseplate subunit TssE [Sorangium sp. So ce1389]|uniref:type VI secretion system baseplate subunit TssE n=1 Tax=Sorangium sp. So ce1389 TaxID=3133336 RepID=UPI003F63F422